MLLYSWASSRSGNAYKYVQYINSHHVCNNMKTEYNHITHTHTFVHILYLFVASFPTPSSYLFGPFLAPNPPQVKSHKCAVRPHGRTCRRLDRCGPHTWVAWATTWRPTCKRRRSTCKKITLPIHPGGPGGV